MARKGKGLIVKSKRHTTGMGGSTKIPKNPKGQKTS